LASHTSQHQRPKLLHTCSWQYPASKIMLEYHTKCSTLLIFLVISHKHRSSFCGPSTVSYSSLIFYLCYSYILVGGHGNSKKLKFVFFNYWKVFPDDVQFLEHYSRDRVLQYPFFQVQMWMCIVSMVASFFGFFLLSLCASKNTARTVLQKKPLRDTKYGFRQQ
jgi:hypothetical protein